MLCSKRGFGTGPILLFTLMLTSSSCIFLPKSRKRPRREPQFAYEYWQPTLMGEETLEIVQSKQGIECTLRRRNTNGLGMHFAVGQATLPAWTSGKDKESKKHRRFFKAELKRMIGKNKQPKFQIVGHASRGEVQNPEQAQALSQKRAEALGKFLISQGFKKSYFDILGQGWASFEEDEFYQKVEMLWKDSAPSSDVESRQPPLPKTLRDQACAFGGQSIGAPFLEDAGSGTLHCDGQRAELASQYRLPPEVRRVLDELTAHCRLPQTLEQPPVKQP